MAIPIAHFAAKMLQVVAWQGVCGLLRARQSAREEAQVRCAGAQLCTHPWRPTAASHLCLQGLCKLGSAGGTDFSMKQFAEGSTLKLAKQCRK